MSNNVQRKEQKPETTRICGVREMMNDCNHEYCKNAFRLYSMCGCPQRKELEQLDYLDPSLEDLAAVSRTIDDLMDENDGKDVVDCVRAVYMLDPEELCRKGTVTLRVRRASDMLSISESTVYRNLRHACSLFSKNRGLRNPEDETWLVNLFK